MNKDVDGEKWGKRGKGEEKEDVDEKEEKNI